MKNIVTSIVEWLISSGSKYGFSKSVCSELEKATGCEIVDSPNYSAAGKCQSMVVSYKDKSQERKLARFCKQRKFKVFEVRRVQLLKLPEWSK